MIAIYSHTLKIIEPRLFRKFINKWDTLRSNTTNANFKLDSILNSDNSIQLKKNILNYCPHCWDACEAYPSILSNLIYVAGVFLRYNRLYNGFMAIVSL